MSHFSVHIYPIQQLSFVLICREKEVCVCVFIRIWDLLDVLCKQLANCVNEQLTRTKNMEWSKSCLHNKLQQLNITFYNYFIFSLKRHIHMKFDTNIV